MDSLKLYTRNDDAFGGLLICLKRFSDDICMDFKLGNCILAIFKLGKLISIKNIILHVDSGIRKSTEESTYNIWMWMQAMGHRIQRWKKNQEKKSGRVIMTTELNLKNIITAINTLDIRDVIYSFDIINWKLEAPKKTDVSIRNRHIECPNIPQLQSVST